MEWEKVPEYLRRWHENGCRGSAREALVFLEVQLRLMVPSIVWRKWGEDQIEDVLREILKRLIEDPLPTKDIGNSQGYFRRILYNQFISEYRKDEGADKFVTEKGEAFREWVSPVMPSPETLLAQQQREKQLHDALAKLSIEDRVAIKLVEGAHWLSDEEIRWLSKRSEVSFEEMKQMILHADDVYDLSLLFDPGNEDPNDKVVRRTRMERFRKRRERVRKKLFELLEGGSK